MIRTARIYGLALALSLVGAAASAQVAKQQFGGKDLPAVLPAAAHGFYSKGCLAGGVAIAQDGPTWQAMRPHRNRRWGHPETIRTVIELSQDAQRVGWNGLLVGDISQPRGGPMLSGHASHQLGLDADIWLNEMPDRRLSRSERNNTSAKSMLASRNGKLDPNTIGPLFTTETFGLIKTAASYRQVERVLVHPTIKRELCRRENATGNARRWLHKVRPYWGHHYHMHVRLSCPAGSPNCRPQAKPRADDGCGKELADWAKLLNPPPRRKSTKKTKPAPAKKKREIRVSDLPNACRAVLGAPQPVTASAAEVQLFAGRILAPDMEAIETVATDSPGAPSGPLTVPTFRPVRD